MLCLHRYCTHRMGRALSTLIGPEVLAVRSNNSEGMGEEGGQESVVVPSLSSSHPHSPLTPPFILIHTAPRRPGVRSPAGVPRKIKRRPSLISLLFHTMFALWDHSQLMLELIVLQMWESTTCTKVCQLICNLKVNQIIGGIELFVYLCNIVHNFNQDKYSHLELE